MRNSVGSPGARRASSGRVRLVRTTGIIFADDTRGSGQQPFDDRPKLVILPCMFAFLVPESLRAMCVSVSQLSPHKFWQTTETPHVGTYS